MSGNTITIPSVGELRETIRSRAEELRALRRLLKLAEAAQAAHVSGEQSTSSSRQEAAHA